MKKKILAMLCASLLISFSAVACDSSEEPAPECSTHVDADNNGYCDNCNVGVIKLVETLPAEPEAYKEMVVNAIPEGGKLTDYVKFDIAEADVIPASAALVELESYQNLNANCYSVVKERQQNEENGYFYDTYELYNTKTNAKIYSFVSEEYSYSYATRSSVTVDLNSSYYFKVVEKIYENEMFEETTYIRDYNGKLIAKAEGSVSVSSLGDPNPQAGYYYVNFDGKIYGFDAETKELVVNGAAPDFFVKRPAFSSVIGSNGYVINYDTVYVYDISDWLETTFVYTAPSYLEESSIYVLSNGNILVQGLKALSNNAVNYDVIENGYKYDVVQLIINPTTGEEKAVEFGYVIQSFVNSSNTDILVNESSNAAIVCPIVDKAVDFNKQLSVIIDSELNILYGYKPAVLGQVNELPEALSADRFLSTIEYGDGTPSEIIVDAEGKLITYVPNGAVIENGYIRVGDKIYDYDLNLKVNLENYTVENVFVNGAMLLSKMTDDEEPVKEYFYFNAKATSVTKLLSENEKIGTRNSDYFVVERTSIDPETSLDVTTYIMFNANCKRVATFEAPISGFTTIGEDMYKVTSDGKTYIIK